MNIFTNHNGLPFFMVDGTYKLVRGKYVLIILGCENLNHKFAPVSFMLTYKEGLEEYKTIFRETKKGLKNMFAIDFNPKFAIFDGATYISNAALAEFTTLEKIIGCRFHLLQNWKRYIGKNGLSGLSSLIFGYYKILIKARSNEEIRKIWPIIKNQLIKKRCDGDSKCNKDSLEKIMEYFNRSLFQGKQCFLNCAGFPGMPRTNNSLERFNLTIKNRYFANKKVNLNEFIVKAKVFVRDFSLDYVISSDEERNINKKIWNSAYILSKKNFIEKDGFYLFEKKKIKLLGNNGWKKTINMKLKDLDGNSLIKTYIMINFIDINCKKCSCTTFWKVGVCKHYLAIMIKKEKINLPEDIIICQTIQPKKRKIGRPKNRKGALSFESSD